LHLLDLGARDDRLRQSRDRAELGAHGRQRRRARLPARRHVRKASQADGGLEQVLLHQTTGAGGEGRGRRSDEEPDAMNKAKYILFLVDHNRRRARAVYAETYHRAFDDPAIDEDLHHALGEHDFDERGESVVVKAELLLGLILRPRGQGKGRKRPPLERLEKRGRDFAIISASLGWAKLVAAGGRKVSKQARHDEAVKA